MKALIVMWAAEQEIATAAAAAAAAVRAVEKRAALQAELAKRRAAQTHTWAESLAAVQATAQSTAQPTKKAPEKPIVHLPSAAGADQEPDPPWLTATWAPYMTEYMSVLLRNGLCMP